MSCRKWLTSGMGLHVAPHGLFSVGWVDDCIRRSRNCLLSVLGLAMRPTWGEVMMMTHVCCLDDALVGEYVWGIQCVLLSGL